MWIKSTARGNDLFGDERSYYNFNDCVLCYQDLQLRSESHKKKLSQKNSKHVSKELT